MFPLGAVIGGGLGLLGSVIGGGGPEQSTTTRLDPETQKWLQMVRGRAQRGAADISRIGQLTPGIGSNRDILSAINAFRGLGTIGDNPLYQQYISGAQGLLGGLDYAMSPFSADQVSQYYNPYEQQVVGGLQADYDRQRQLAMQSGAQQATRAGAFGGSRGAVLQANLLGDIGRSEAGTLAQVRQAGYGQALGQLQAEKARMGQLGLAGLGGLFGGLQYGNQYDVNRAQQLLSLGEYQRGIQAQQNLDPITQQQAIMSILGGVPLPGTGTTTSWQRMYQNPVTGALGGALTGMSLFPGAPGQFNLAQAANENPFTLLSRAGW